MGTIILVRHGENDWSKENKLAGRIPGVHLNETGHRQAHAVAQRLAALPLKAVYSSPITRCVETAAYIADIHRLSIQHVDEVGEVEYGEWEGKKIKKLAKTAAWRAVQFFPSRVRFPRGEALREVQFRAVQAIEEIAAHHEEDLVAVVSHADIIRLVLAHYLGVHIDLFQRLVISPASASILSLDADGMVRVLRVNDDGPLHPPKSSDDDAKEKKKDRKSKTGHKRAKAAPAQAEEREERATFTPSVDGAAPDDSRKPLLTNAPDEEE